MKIKYEPAAWSKNPAIVSSGLEGKYQRFILKGRTDVVSCEVLDTAGTKELLAYPERSSGHKALFAALGLNEGAA